MAGGADLNPRDDEDIDLFLRLVLAVERLSEDMEKILEVVHRAEEREERWRD